MAEMAAAQSNEDLLLHYCQCMEGMKISVLSDFAHNDILRQQIALLFAQAQRGAEMLLVRGEPVLRAVDAPVQKLPALWRLLQNPALLYGVLGAGAVVSLFSNLRALLFFGLAAALVYLREGRKDEQKQSWTAAYELRLEALEAYIERQAQLLDAHVQDLCALLEDASAPLPELTLERDVMTLCQYVWAGAHEGCSLDSALNAAEKVIERSELEWAEYSEKTRRLYEVMPTRRESRTVYPALIKKTDGTLAQRGQRLENRERSYGRLL